MRKTLLDRIIDERLLTARGVYGFWPANADGDDIVVYADDSRRAELERFPMLRQQEIIADVARICPSLTSWRRVESGVPDYLGMFAVTAGIGADELARRFEKDLDDYNAIMVKALADRLAEAFAEYLHAQARQGLGIRRAGAAVDEDIVAEKYRGIRPAYGYPACPDHSEKCKLFDLLERRTQGITLTETPRCSRPRASAASTSPIRRRSTSTSAVSDAISSSRTPAARACGSRPSRSGSPSNLAYDPSTMAVAHSAVNARLPGGVFGSE